MRKNLTEIVFILDRSGSMSGLEQDTIGGFNSMIKQQKNAEGEALISTILFDNVSEVLHDRINVKDIQPLSDHDYMVRGCTALLDAIGGAIHHIGNIHKYARREDVPEHIMFVITTDGMENASRYYSSNKVKQMIERQPLTFSGEDTESKRFVMIKTFESERGKEYTSSRGLKKNNGERGFRQMYCCLKKCK